MGAFVTLILAALQAVEALLSASGVTNAMVDAVINLLVQIIPLLETEARTVIPYIQNIIAALKNNPATTAAQLAQLSTLDAAADDAFEKAAAADGSPSAGA